MAEEACTPEEMTFGAALEELEHIVRVLETGQLELEESLALYERGVALLSACQKKLHAAQQRVTLLLGEIEGEQEREGIEESADEEAE